ncbi:MAG: M14 family metallopeptidase [Elusimicrobiales bacterium]|nr:M14 family metallopeptidase [Elusimicrobiales bacterium]
MKLLLCAALLSTSVAVNAESSRPENISFNQLLAEITAPEALQVPEPSLDKTILAESLDNRYWVTVRAQDKYVRTRLLEAGLDIVEINKDTVSGFAGPYTMGLLSAKAFTVLSRVPAAQYISGLTRDFPAQDAAYHNYKETSDLLAQMAARHSDIASLFSIGKTVEGRDMWCLRINSTAKGSAPSAKPGAFFLGNMHAREHLANEIPLLFAAWLLDHRNDVDVKKYIGSLDIYIVPMLNSDGAEFDIASGSYQYYRKNMSKNANGSRGVDLNRNFDSWWCESGASSYPGSDTYCGPKAFSEPESQAVKNFMEARRNIKTHISYHTYGSTILYPWGGSEDEVSNPKDKQAFIKLAGEMGKLTGYLPQKSSDMYVATGDSCDWAYAATGALSFTFELEGRGFYPGAAIIKAAVEKNVKAAVYLLSVTDNPYKAI